MKPILRFVPMPIVFLFSHFLLFFAIHLVAVVSYHSFWFNSIFCFSLLQMAVYNGACYYMDYFSKKYVKELEKLA